MPEDMPPREAVLVTRPQPGAGVLAARLRELGHRAVLAPFLRIAPVAARLPDPAKVQAVLVTSAQALPALPPSGLPLLAVGDATAARASARGFTLVHSAGGDGVALAGLAARLLDPAGAPLLLASGRGQGGALAAALRTHGFRVLRRTAYAATPVRTFPAAAAAALRQGSLRAALFLSAETALAFARTLPPALAPALRGVDALTIGGSTATALHGLPWRDVRVADHPTADGVLALL